ncbi:MAG: hypothetical protein LBL55_09305 [Propionibacteriaceae bacterium]|jgi:hypothetical protein|nr:hypothetical protein [Propionibacteriaceae bacterium]
MIDNEAAKALADAINPDNTFDPGGGLVVTDVLLVVRSRHPDDLSLSVVSTVSNPEADFITLAGMVHFARLFNEGRGEQ